MFSAFYRYVNHTWLWTFCFNVNFRFDHSLIEIYFELVFQRHFLEERFARDRFVRGLFFEVHFFAPFLLLLRVGFGFFGFLDVLNPCFSHVSNGSPLFSIWYQSARVSVTRVSFLFFVFASSLSCRTGRCRFVFIEYLNFHTSVVLGKRVFFRRSHIIFKVVFGSL